MKLNLLDYKISPREHVQRFGLEALDYTYVVLNSYLNYLYLYPPELG